MAAAATARQAAAAAAARALAVAVREFLVDACGGDACGCVRLLLSRSCSWLPRCAPSHSDKLTKELQQVKGGSAGRRSGARSASARCAC